MLLACSTTANGPVAPRASDQVATAVTAALSRYTSTDRVRAVIVTVDGQTRFERYYSAAAEDHQPVWSVTKSVVSALVGIAIEEGRLSLDAPLSQLLPDHAGQMSPSVAGATLRQLLTMTAGFADTWEPTSGDDLMAAPDWTRFILQRQEYRPGQEFHYSDPGVHLLAPILVHATGQPILAYAVDKLFGPMGIPTTPAREPPVDAAHAADFFAPGFAWSVDPQGFSTTAGGLKLRPRDMAAFGQLFLQEGLWGNRQVVPASWVRQATSAQTAATFRAFRSVGAFDPIGYGYLWWVDRSTEHHSFFAHGYGGQLIKVVPALRLVIVMSSFVDIANPNAIVLDPDVEQEVADAIIAALTKTVHSSR
jgi:CubicO group peptidase (beta-lactamase class C family)